MMILPVTLEVGCEPVHSYALIDSGAEGKAFVDESWARGRDLPLTLMKNAFRLTVFDGTETESGVVSHYLKCDMR